MFSGKGSAKEVSGDSELFLVGMVQGENDCHAYQYSHAVPFPGYTQQLHHLVCLGHSGYTSLLYCEQSGHVIVSQVVWDTEPSP